MFRKYVALAALAMLAATAVPAFGEETACIPTCGGTCATNSHAITTCEHACTTCSDLTATSQLFSGELSATNATASPPRLSRRTSAGLPSASSGVDYTTQSLSAQEQKMLNLLNSDRKNNGLAALTPDPELSRIARIKSQDMKDRNYFAHESPTYGDVRAMLRTFGYAFQGASENIAHHANVDKAQAAFMTSSGHRSNILSKAWTKVGIGIVLDKDGYIYATQIFAR